MDTDSDGRPDTVPSPANSRTWDLDALGNWAGVTTNGTTQNRTANAQNTDQRPGSSASCGIRTRFLSFKPVVMTCLPKSVR